MSEHPATEETQAGTLAGDDEPAPTRASPDPPRGSSIGRYVVLHTLGRGGMGVVVAAYDPELDRKVAIKLLHEGGAPLRLLAEAQALARLHDPNVVTVHDVGTHADRVFLAMELVAGCTLGAWLARTQPPWTRVLEVMIHAGRGLAAAHARELAHRDFKPDNVMIGDDGRVLVLDFGLVLAADEPSTDAHREGWPRERALGLSMTRRGALVGTPAYMAPELLAGRRGGPAADQFAFCVSLWEALYGQRPFVGRTVVELQARILAGTIEKPPAGARVPGWLRRAAELGLSIDPDRRWPSMQALLDELARGRSRARWRARGLALAAVGAVSLGAWGWQRLATLAHRRACAAEGASLAEVWNDDVAARMLEALRSTGAVHAELTAKRVRPWLDAYAHDWQHARTEACLAAGTSAAELETLERARWCLDERRMELEALVTELRRGIPRMVDAAVPAVATLEPLAGCRDADRWARSPAPPAGEHEAARVIRSESARAAALRRTGAPREGLAAARAALSDAEALQWPPLTAAVRIEVAALLAQLGAYAEAEATLVTAYFDAAQAGADEASAVAAGELALVVGVRLARHRHGLRWARHEGVLVSRLPDPTGLLQARHLAHRAAIHRAAGEYSEARAQLELALASFEDVLGPEHPIVARTLDDLGAVLVQRGELPEAMRLFARALEIHERALGPSHPEVAASLHDLGETADHMGFRLLAQRLLERAVSIQAATLAPGHPELQASERRLAEIDLSLGATRTRPR